MVVYLYYCFVAAWLVITESCHCLQDRPLLSWHARNWDVYRMPMSLLLLDTPWHRELTISELSTSSSIRQCISPTSSLIQMVWQILLRHATWIPREISTLALDKIMVYCLFRNTKNVQKQNNKYRRLNTIGDYFVHLVSSKLAYVAK